MHSPDEARPATPPAVASLGVAPREATAGGVARGVCRALWPWLLIPPLVVAAGVAWLWFGAEGSFVEAGRYTLS